MEIEKFLECDVIVEEKVDGANIGFSIGDDGLVRVQNRGGYLQYPFRGQFSKLNEWLNRSKFKIIECIDTNLIAFGEWSAARHSIKYSNLPDYFLLFDVFDITVDKFWSVEKRNVLAKKLQFSTVPEIGRGKYTVNMLEDLLNSRSSHFVKGPLEGIVIRKDQSDWNIGRAKMVRREFTQAIEEHWSNRVMEWNEIDTGKNI